MCTCVCACVTWFGVLRPSCILCQADGWRQGRKTHTDVASLDLIKASFPAWRRHSIILMCLSFGNPLCKQNEPPPGSVHGIQMRRWQSVRMRYIFYFFFVLLFYHSCCLYGRDSPSSVSSLLREQLLTHTCLSNVYRSCSGGAGDGGVIGVK